MCVILADYMFIKVDSYGTQQPIALLKLLLDRGGMYDRGKDLNYKILKDLGFIAAMGKAGGGRNEVDPRFVSLFSVFGIPFPSVESLHLIYSSIIKGHTKVTVASLKIPPSHLCYFNLINVKTILAICGQHTEHLRKSHPLHAGTVQNDRCRPATHSLQVPLHL